MQGRNFGHSASLSTVRQARECCVVLVVQCTSASCKSHGVLVHQRVTPVTAAGTLSAEAPCCRARVWSMTVVQQCCSASAPCSGARGGSGFGRSTRHFRLRHLCAACCHNTARFAVLSSRVGGCAHWCQVKTTSEHVCGCLVAFLSWMTNSMRCASRLAVCYCNRCPHSPITAASSDMVTQGRLQLG
jgi:hypothetical protein